MAGGARRRIWTDKANLDTYEKRDVREGIPEANKPE